MFFSRAMSVVIFFSFIVVSCQGDPDKKASELKVNLVKEQGDTTLLHVSQGLSGIVFDSSELDHFFSIFPEFREYSPDYRTFYRNRSYNYAWYHQDGLIETAHSLLAHLQETDSLGLPMKIPQQDTLHKLLHYDDHERDMDHLKPDITTELLLTGQYFHYVKVKYGQRLQGSQEKIDWYLPRKKVNYDQLLEQTIAGNDIDKVASGVMNRHFNALRQQLKRFREIEARYPAEQQAISIVKTIKPDDSSTAVPDLRKRLHMYGFLNSETGSNRFDRDLVKAVNQYKKTVGLKQDSLVTAEVAAALNVPVRKRIETILVNMERFRWMPKIKQEGEFIFVNIPEFRLHYFEDGKDVWDCNVVVGKPMTKTVIFSGDLKNVVFSPYWYVPPSIINKEVKPGMARNSNYLASHNMEWNGGNVRQKPGIRNSLGLVKFIFPNSNNIYLHDTPSKSLFKEDNRAFSHGCVRVGEPRALAIRILKNDPTWTPEKIDEAMHSGVEKFVPIRKKLPVVIGYFTAFVDSEGDLNFRKDIYARDQRLYDMIAESR
jgi:murein L,D-transpeptidase YcbB/YkuD